MSWIRLTCSPDSPSLNSMAAASASIIPWFSSTILRAFSRSSHCCSSTTLLSRALARNSSTTDCTRRSTT